MSVKTWNIKKIVIWFLLAAFVLVAIILPAASPLAVAGEIIALIVILKVVSPIFLDTQGKTLKCVGSGYEWPFQKLKLNYRVIDDDLMLSTAAWTAAFN